MFADAGTGGGVSWPETTYIVAVAAIAREAAVLCAHIQLAEHVITNEW